MKITPLIYDFRGLLPGYRFSQEDALHWIAAAHAQSEVRASGQTSLLPKWVDRMDRLVKRFGCSPKHIKERRFGLSDFTHDRWEKMLIFNLASTTEGEGTNARNQFYTEVADRLVNQFYANE